MTTHSSNSGNSDDRLREVAAALDDRVSPRLSDWFSVVESDELPREEEGRVGFGVRVDAQGRLQTTPNGTRHRPTDWRLAPEEGFPCEHELACRTFLESRIVALAVGIWRDELSSLRELADAPFPEISTDYLQQLEFLGRHAEREVRAGWAVERIAAECYGLALNELVAIQRGFSET